MATKTKELTYFDVINTTLRRHVRENNLKNISEVFYATLKTTSNDEVSPTTPKTFEVSLGILISFNPSFSSAIFKFSISD